MLTFQLRTDHYHVLPIPFIDAATPRTPRLGSCFVGVDQLPADLTDWMEVNPRIPKRGRNDLELQGPVAKGIVETLLHEPEMMCVRNNGIFLLVESANFKKEPGGRGVLTVRLENRKLHGIVNGGHTFAAIRQVAEQADRPEPWGALVRLHIYEGIGHDYIADIAEGMNRSLQVDDASLENLQGTFDEIKKALAGKSGADKIAYRQGDKEDVEVQFILTVMAMLNLSKYPDRKVYPNRLFGQPRGVLEEFLEEKNDMTAREDAKSYRILLPKLHEILVLSDLIQKGMADRLGKLKIRNAQKDNRVAAKRHKDIPAHFAGGTIGGNIPLGWLYPVLAAFRANIDPTKWRAGIFSWLANPQVLLEGTIEEMCEVIRQEHVERKQKPADVGRKETAYRLCYGVVMMELSSKGT